MINHFLVTYTDKSCDVIECEKEWQALARSHAHKTIHSTYIWRGVWIMHTKYVQG